MKIREIGKKKKIKITTSKESEHLGSSPFVDEHIMYWFPFHHISLGMCSYSQILIAKQNQTNKQFLQKTLTTSWGGLGEKKKEIS